MCLAWRTFVVGREQTDMTEQNPVEEGNGRRRKRLSPSRAALKLTSPLLPVMAVVLTALTYIILGEPPDRTIVLVGLSINEGILASFVGLVLALSAWVAVSFPARKRATAKESSPPNYHQITEALDSLKYKIKSVCPNGDPTPRWITGSMRCQSVKLLRR
jgi:hypothetical protein